MSENNPRPQEPTGEGVPANIPQTPASPMISPESIGPFARFCCTLGMIPSSYKVSMTYEEQLMWLCNYLENTIIPTINNNSQATQEIQTLFVELSNYVANYFENLDVQNEINNKLDTMAEDGTLMSLIGPYLQPYINSQNARITQLENYVASTVNINPLVATSIAEMTDTTRIYVLTTDGHWYYYDGDSWEIGGTYQSTGIGENAISPFNLESDFRKDLKYSIPEYSLTNGSYISASSNHIVTNEYSTGYSYSTPIHLKKDQTIYLKGAGTSGAIAVISECNSEGTTFKWLVRSLGTDVASYKYTATKDMYVTISSITSKLSNVIISSFIIAEEDLPKYIDLKSNSNDITIICDDSYSNYVLDKYVNYGNGNYYNYTNMNSSDFIEINPNCPMKLKAINNLVSSPDARGLAFYNEEKIYISGIQYTNTNELSFTSPPNARYINFTVPNSQYTLSYTSLKTYLDNSFSITDNYKDLFKSFLHVGIIGDSLASGESAYKQNGTTKYVDIYEQSWGQYMARMSGNTYYNFSKGGLSTRGWLINNHGYPLASDGNHDCEAYIIALGENDWRIEDYLGTNSDINLQDYTQNADTFYGNYAGIIQRMKIISPKAKFFLMTLPSTNATKQAFNVAIRYMATIFDNVYILDLENDYINYFKSGSFISNNSRGSHYNAIAYNYMSQLFMNWLSKIMNDNVEDFRQVEFINTDYEWTN